MRSIHHALTLAVAIIVPPFVSVPLAAQDSCSGPGAAFGVVSYQCGSCTMQQKPGARPIWQFRTEPMILKTTEGSPLLGGDIVQAVDGKPITTAGGAEAFTYPALGEFVVTVRRAGRQIAVRVRVSVDCSQAGTSGAVGPTSAAPPEPVAAKPRGRFGFAIACSNCTRQVGPDGIGYWTFESKPVIGDLEPGSPAAASGLHVGDVIEEVDDHPVLERAGALALAKADSAPSLRLTVRRPDGARLTVTLQARPRDH